VVWWLQHPKKFKGNLKKNLWLKYLGWDKKIISGTSKRSGEGSGLKKIRL